MTRRTFSAFVVSLLALVPAGCNDEKPANADRAKELLSNLSPMERSALADKTVSFGEYDASVRAERECIVGLGYQADPVNLGVNGLLTFTYGVEGVDDKRLETMEKQSAACFRLGDAIEAVYSTQHAVSEEERTAAIGRFRTCAQGLGIAGAETKEVGPLLQEIYEKGYARQITAEAGRACIDIINAVTTAPTPGLKEALDALVIK